MNTQTLTFPRRELPRRVNGGLEITLYWDARNNSTTIELHHVDTAKTIAFAVSAEGALDAFHHPFAHLAARDAA